MTVASRAEHATNACISRRLYAPIGRIMSLLAVLMQPSSSARVARAMRVTRSDVCAPSLGDVGVNEQPLQDPARLVATLEEIPTSTQGESSDTSDPDEHAGSCHKMHQRRAAALD